MKYVPFHYQQRMEDWLYKRRFAALFCSPGLGKTVVTIRAWERLAIEGESRGLLIIAPLRVCNITWPNEVAKWDFAKWIRIANLRTPEGIQMWKDKSADIYVASPEMLPSKVIRRKCPECKDEEGRRTCKKCKGEGKLESTYLGFVDTYLLKARAEDLPVDMICLDEMSLAKNQSSKRYESIRAHRDKFKRFWGLTGTPAPNSYIDLWAPVRFLDNGKRLGRSFNHFQQTFFQPVPTDNRKFVIRKDGAARIEKRLAGLALTMLGDDYLDVPTCTSTDIMIDLPKKAMAEYEELERFLLLQLEEGEIEALNAAALTNKLLQLTGGAVYDADKEVHFIHDAKIKALRKLQGQHKGEPLLVLTQFKHERARLLEAFPEAKLFSEKGLPDWQAGKIPMWIADPRSMSHGIDGLQQGGRIAVWLTLTYSNESFIQTNARLVRTGQSFETIIYRILVNRSVDEAVAEALRTKSRRQTGLLLALKNLQQLKS